MDRQNSIFQESEYWVTNGLLGMMRDVLLRLMGIIKDAGTIRKIFGMCQEFLKFRKHRFFKKIREGNFNYRLSATPHNCVIKKLDVDFSGNERLTLYFLPKIVSGVVKLSFTVKNISFSYPFCVGVVEPENCSSDCCIGFGANNGGCLCIHADSVCLKNNRALLTVIDSKCKIQNDHPVFIEMEVNMNEHLLYFFSEQTHSDVIIPCLTDLPSALYMGISSSYGMHEVRVVSVILSHKKASEVNPSRLKKIGWNQS